MDLNGGHCNSKFDRLQPKRVSQLVRPLTPQPALRRWVWKDSIRLQAPGLAFLALLLRPDSRLQSGMRISGARQGVDDQS